MLRLRILTCRLRELQECQSLAGQVISIVDEELLDDDLAGAVRQQGCLVGSRRVSTIDAWLCCDSVRHQSVLLLLLLLCRSHRILPLRLIRLIEALVAAAQNVERVAFVMVEDYLVQVRQ